MRRITCVVSILTLTAAVSSLDVARDHARLFAQAAAAADWPQWRGPDRSGISKETGLLRQWPASGPPVAWTAANLGGGYGSVAISGERVFVQGMRGNQSLVFSLNRADGKVVWSKALGPMGDNDRGSGPRGTPAVDGDRLYALTEMGDLACLRVADGSVVWQRNILKEFGGSNINWLISESPLVDGDRLIVTPGGRGAGLAALDKMTGKTIWTTKEMTEDAGYASPIVADVQGVRTIMTFTADAGVGVRASDGKLMFRYRGAANGTANITTPVYANNQVFFSSAYGTGGGLVALKAGGGEVRAQEVYFTRDMQNHHGGLVLVNGYLYGFNNSILTCLEWATGKQMWRDRSVGKGNVIAADGHLYILSENNVVGLVEATPAGYREKGRFTIRDHGWPSWSHPAIAGGLLYIRDQGTLAAYDIRQRN
jgi:outer membrane protein assembly factor BamB